jgi:hypothetical protein
MNRESQHDAACAECKLDPERTLPTVEDVREALRQAAPGANELNRQLDQVFTLSEASAMLRLR